MFSMQEPFISAELAYRRERFRSGNTVVTEQRRRGLKGWTRRYRSHALGQRHSGVLASR